MAKVIPEGWRELPVAGAAQRVIETLGLLASGLSDDYAVYHGVHWTRVEHGSALLGEIDFAIVGPNGKLLLVEQKSGLLAETPEGLVKVYAAKQRLVAHELGHTLAEFARRLRRSCPQVEFDVDVLLYCPDYAVKQPGTAGIDAQRIVDASRREALLAIVRSLLPAREEAPGEAADAPSPSATATATATRSETRGDEQRRTAVQRFLADLLQLVPDVHALAGQVQTLYTRLSGGLAQWARQIECEPFRLRVIGTAGSGKTQLALAVLRDARAAGRRPLYVCFNRPLADHVALIAPPGAEVATYHQLADRLARSLGQPVDFAQPGAFSRLEQVFDAYARGEASDPRWRFDEIVIDEGQDFEPQWRDNVLALLAAPGRAWWLEDPLQNLYARPAAELPGWVTVRSQTNYRSPQDVLAQLNRLLPEGAGVHAGSPLFGSQLDLIAYCDADDLLTQTKRAITQCIGAGFKRDMIALVTYHGRESSLLAMRERLGPYPLRSFSGGYDLLGNPLFTAGDVLVDSVYRFKGQAAPCVVFSEIDFAELDERAQRKLFVGATRATMKLTLVVAQRTLALLRERLGVSVPS